MYMSHDMIKNFKSKLKSVLLLKTTNVCSGLQRPIGECPYIDQSICSSGTVATTCSPLSPWPWHYFAACEFPPGIGREEAVGA